ncbi:Type II secretion system protein G precursor [Poriferisphaera corsica]|uniref:Type II secretion system protein G n=2 Tax=Poriferisphaera corsica TaxID=2528020 RepID=A0A517YWK0_9BACT|nr:Type II secretion system protein G precursor [Poriferisphaera corsica]
MKKYKQAVDQALDIRRQVCGFSLVELMVVLVILGLLAGVVTVSTRMYMSKAKVSASRMEIKTICSGLETFYTLYDRFPSSDEGLDVLTVAQEGEDQAILMQKLIDPWGKPYQYNSPGREGAYDVYSLGADGREGGEGSNADIGNWNLKGR